MTACSSRTLVNFYHIILVSHPILQILPACNTPFTWGTNISLVKIIHNKWYQNENTQCSLVSTSVQYLRCKRELTAKVSFIQKILTTWPTASPEPGDASSALLHEWKQIVLHCSSLDSLQTKTSLFRGDKLDYFVLSAHIRFDTWSRNSELWNGPIYVQVKCFFSEVQWPYMHYEVSAFEKFHTGSLKMPDKACFQ
jgi:hypothetical protein